MKKKWSNGFDPMSQKWDNGEPDVSWDDTELGFDKNPNMKPRRGVIVRVSRIGYPMFGSECVLSRIVTVEDCQSGARQTRRYYGDMVTDYEVGCPVLFSWDRDWLEYDPNPFVWVAICFAESDTYKVIKAASEEEAAGIGMYNGKSIASVFATKTGFWNDPVLDWDRQIA
jgi:hypothetical protein